MQSENRPNGEITPMHETMHETKPHFMIKKYRSILRAAIIVESVNFFVSLTDSIVAGSLISGDAFTAIGLIIPFATISIFFSTIVYTGTVVNFSYQVGRFDKRRANEFFSQGLMMAFLSGVLYASLLFLLGSFVITRLTDDETIRGLMSEYFYTILWLYLLSPLGFFLDNMVVADGGEKLSAGANITQIICNIVCSIVFASFWGIKGIAAASVLGEVVFLLLISLHFFSKKNTLKFTLHWTRSDFFTIVRGGVAKASTYGLEALMTLVINFFALQYFGSDTLVILVVVERFLGLMTLFLGLSTSCQPLIGTLRGENNTKGQRMLMQTVLRDIIVSGVVLTVILFSAAPALVSLFGVTEDGIYAQAVSALRIVSLTLVLQGVLVLFFVYYVFIEKPLLAFIICLIKSFLSPVACAVIFSVLLGSQSGLWIGAAAAPVFTSLLCYLSLLFRYGRESIPFLIPKDRDDRIFIYDFTIDPESAVEMSRTVGSLAAETSLPPKTRAIAGFITEDVLMLILEKNTQAKQPIRAECTVMRESDGLRLIFRDSGVIFNITDADLKVDSLRQFIVSNIMINQEIKMYTTTTGYNRSEFFFAQDMNIQ